MKITVIPAMTPSGKVRWHFVTPSVYGGFTKSLNTWATRASALRAGRREWLKG